MDRFDIYVKQAPSFVAEDGMAQVGYHSGDMSFQVIMPMSVFARALTEANDLFAMWEAEQSGRFIREFPVRNRAKGGPDDHAA